MKSGRKREPPAGDEERGLVEDFRRGGDAGGRAWRWGTDFNRRAFLGVSLADADGAGARVSEVIEDSPAAEAGLAVGDVITSVDGEAVQDPRDVTRLIRAHKPGEEVTLSFSRGEEALTARARLVRRDDVVVDPADPTVRARAESETEELSVALRASPLSFTRVDAWRSLPDPARRNALLEALRPLRRNLKNDLAALALQALREKQRSIDNEAIDRLVDTHAEKLEALLKQHLAAGEFEAWKQERRRENSLSVELVRRAKEEQPLAPGGDEEVF